MRRLFFVALLLGLAGSPFSALADEEEPTSPKELSARLKDLLKEKPRPFEKVFDVLESLAAEGSEDSLRTLEKTLRERDRFVAVGAAHALARVGGECAGRATKALVKELVRRGPKGGFVSARIIRLLSERDYRAAFPELKALFLKTEDVQIVRELTKAFSRAKDWRMLRPLSEALVEWHKQTGPGSGVGPIGSEGGDGEAGSSESDSEQQGRRALDKRYAPQGVETEKKKIHEEIFEAIFSIIGVRLKDYGELARWMTENRKLINEKVKQMEESQR